MPKKKNSLPPFVALLWEMLNSRAYKELNSSAAKALPYFLGKFRGAYRDPQRYKFVFPFSYSEAEWLGFASSTFSRVIQELVRKGFIDPVDKGGLRSDGKSYNLFSLSERWKEYRTARFEDADWKCFKPRTRLKATPESEIYRCIKGNGETSNDNSISENEVVGAF
jgi:hypothetical protein